MFNRLNFNMRIYLIVTKVVLCIKRIVEKKLMTRIALILILLELQ